MSKSTAILDLSTFSVLMRPEDTTLARMLAMVPELAKWKRLVNETLYYLNELDGSPLQDPEHPDQTAGRGAGWASRHVSYVHCLIGDLEYYVARVNSLGGTNPGVQPEHEAARAALVEALQHLIERWHVAHRCAQAALEARAAQKAAQEAEERRNQRAVQEIALRRPMFNLATRARLAA